MGNVIIRGGSVVTSERMFVGDIVVRNGRIAAVVETGKRTAGGVEGRHAEETRVEETHVAADGHRPVPASFTHTAYGMADAHVIDATGKYVLPGLIDVHVHFRDPGTTHKEDFATGTAAAAAGGVTTVLDMPNTVPPVSTAAILEEKAAGIAEHAYVDYGLYGVINEHNLDELAGLARAGACAFKLFLGPTTGDIRAPGWGRLIDVFETVHELGLPLVVHAEDRDVIEYWEHRMKQYGRDAAGNDATAGKSGPANPAEVGDGSGNAAGDTTGDRTGGRIGDRTRDSTGTPRLPRLTDDIGSYRAFLATRPRFGEAAATQTVCLLAAMTNTPVHIAHVSIAEAVDVIRHAKRSGAPVTAETCPTYLTMTAADCQRLGPVSKILPPIREQSDQDALWRGLHDGTIDIISTDHAPHEPEAKRRLPWSAAAGGMIGVQTMLPVLLTEVERGRLSLHDVVRWTSRGPAELFGLAERKGDVRVGLDADLVVVDPSRETTVVAEHLHSKSKNSPLIGMALRGTVVHTIVRGRVVVRDGLLDGVPLGEQI